MLSLNKISKQLKSHFLWLGIFNMINFGAVVVLVVALLREGYVFPLNIDLTILLLAITFVGYIGVLALINRVKINQHQMISEVPFYIAIAVRAIQLIVDLSIGPFVLSSALFSIAIMAWLFKISQMIKQYQAALSA